MCPSQLPWRPDRQLLSVSQSGLRSVESVPMIVVESSVVSTTGSVVDGSSVESVTVVVAVESSVELGESVVASSSVVEST